MADLVHLIADTMGDSLGGVPADHYRSTAHDVLAAIEEAGYTIDRKPAIVMALAEMAAPLNTDLSACVLCGTEAPPPSEDDPDDHELEEGTDWHHSTCPWRMACEEMNQ